MASRCSRIFQKSSISTLKSAISKSASSSLNRSATSTTTHTRPSLSQNQFPLPFADSVSPGIRKLYASFVVTGGVGMRGVHAAAAQCGGEGEVDVVPELIVFELSGSFSGYTLLHFSRSLVIGIFILPELYAVL
ncbi:hypothetical protein DH2020_005284 [Rehmannia glutinosa]|uniref:Uncharacterized protein n=1 Tax=Rehmannia glutinosa TaxID=99300 RepID=A0ABR0XFP2_REHGL